MRDFEGELATRGGGDFRSGDAGGDASLDVPEEECFSRELRGGGRVRAGGRHMVLLLLLGAVHSRASIVYASSQIRVPWRIPGVFSC